MSSTVIGLGAEAAWWLLLAVIALVTVPRRPRASQPDNTLLPGMRTLLAHRAREGWIAAAVDATFADLVRRGWIEASPHEVRIGKGRRTKLDPSEKLVFRHVKAVVERSPQGTAPMAALLEGPESGDEWQEFGALLEADAKKRGLIKDRISMRTIVLMAVAGGLASDLWIYSLSDEQSIAVLVVAFILSAALHVLPVLRLRRLVPTAAGAQAAGAMQTVTDGPGLGKRRSNQSGWTYDKTTGWRQWEISDPGNDVVFSRWPNKIFAVTAIIWAACLAIALASIGLDSFEFGYAIGFSFQIYFAAILLRLGAGAYRGIVVRRRGREFNHTRTPIVGQVVRTYERVYYVGEDRNEVTEHCVVIDPGPGRSAVMFTVPEKAFSSVREGQTSVRALQKWRSADAETFEVIR